MPPNRSTAWATTATAVGRLDVTDDQQGSAAASVWVSSAPVGRVPGSFDRLPAVLASRATFTPPSAAPRWPARSAAAAASIVCTGELAHGRQAWPRQASRHLLIGRSSTVAVVEITSEPRRSRPRRAKERHHERRSPAPEQPLAGLGTVTLMVRLRRKAGGRIGAPAAGTGLRLDEVTNRYLAITEFDRCVSRRGMRASDFSASASCNRRGRAVGLGGRPCARRW